MVIAVIAAGPMMTLATYAWSLISFIGSFSLGVLGWFVPF
jgi:hypothetical protein